MAGWILVVGYDRHHLDAARRDWLKFNTHIDSVDTASDAIERFSHHQYLAVIASYDVHDLTTLIDFMSNIKQIPLVIQSQNDSGTKFAESIIRGSNTFIIDADNLIESIRENKDIIDRLAKIPSDERKALGILSHRDIFMLLDYRKVYVRGEEIALAASEFEILQLLLSNTGRVVTYEQIYMYAYGDDVSLDITLNSVRCLMYRIRQRLRFGAESINYIESVRSLGYRMAI